MHIESLLSFISYISKKKKKKQEHPCIFHVHVTLPRSAKFHPRRCLYSFRLSPLPSVSFRRESGHRGPILTKGAERRVDFQLVRVGELASSHHQSLCATRGRFQLVSQPLKLQPPRFFFLLAQPLIHSRRKSLSENTGSLLSLNFSPSLPTFFHIP